MENSCANHRQPSRWKGEKKKIYSWFNVVTALWTYWSAQMVWALIILCFFIWHSQPDVPDNIIRREYQSPQSWDRHTASQHWNSITLYLGEHGSLQSYSAVCRMQLVNTYARPTRMLERNHCSLYLILYYKVYQVMQITLTKCVRYTMIVWVLHSLRCNMLIVATRRD